MSTGRVLYQVFVSSTFRDLHIEREAVSWAILKTRNTPAGMEAFPAADDRGWMIIERTINDSDFYVLLLGYRYGSVDPASGLSWTEKEYRYAREKGIPVLAFLRELSATSAADAETDPALRIKIEAFRKDVATAHHVKPWNNVADLVTHVAMALNAAIQESIEFGPPRQGWIRGSASAIKIAEELAALSDENRSLREELKTLQAKTERVLSERTPSMIHHSAGGAKSSADMSHAFLVQNVGSCGFVVDSISWLWSLAGSGIIRVEHSINPKQPQFVGAGEKSAKFSLAITKVAAERAVGSTIDFSGAYEAVQITAIVTTTSKPHNIGQTQAFAINGELLDVSSLLPGP